jgi:hypothetical protein
MCHAFTDRPDGTGRNHRRMPMPTGTANFQAIPRCPTGGVGVDVPGLAGGETLAMINLLLPMSSAHGVPLASKYTVFVNLVIRQATSSPGTGDRVESLFYD